MAGLPDYYEPMIMALNSSNIKITTDFVKTKLLQDVTWPRVPESQEVSLFSRAPSERRQNYGNGNFSRNNYGHLCCHSCNQLGHISRFCINRRNQTGLLILGPLDIYFIPKTCLVKFTHQI